MALIKCPECGKQISSFATACPQCGCPVEKEQAEPVQPVAPVAPAAPVAPKQEADTIVVECPGLAPNGTCPKLRIVTSAQNGFADMEWGKVMSVKLSSPARVSIVDTAPRMAVICFDALAVVSLLIGLLTAIGSIGDDLLHAGLFALFVWFALCGFGFSLFIVRCSFSAMPGKRYKLFWEKRAIGYKLRAQEVPD